MSYIRFIFALISNKRRGNFTSILQFQFQGFLEYGTLQIFDVNIQTILSIFSLAGV